MEVTLIIVQKKKKISKEIIKKNSAIIKTKFKDPKNSFLDDEYEYHFIKIENNWFLEEVYLIDEDGKYFLVNNRRREDRFSLEKSSSLVKRLSKVLALPANSIR